MISEKDREAIKGLTNIVKVIESSGIALKKFGRLHEACCPFHNEKTPSFKVDEVKGTYHCYGCGEHGDAVSFLQKFRSMTYPDAMRELASQANYVISEEPLTPEQQLREQHRKTQLRLNRRANDFFKAKLRETPQAWAYATSRWSEESIEHWDIGYAPEDKFELWNYLLSMGEKIEDLQESKLFTCKNDEVRFAFFRDRITMPIFSNVNDILAFSARLINVTPANKKYKYLNSGMSNLYSKSEILYGWSFALNEIGRSNSVVMVEGNADVIKMHEIGITNTVAVCGTSFTEKHAKLISSRAKTVVMIFDGDNAGQKATLNNGHLMLKSGLIPYVLGLPTEDEYGNPQKNDPDSFFRDRQHYDDFFSENKEHYILWLTRYKLDAVKNPDPSDINSIIAEVCDDMMLMPEPEREAYIPQLAKICGTPDAWAKNLNERQNVAVKKSVKKLNEQGITAEQESIFDTYGFYEENNCYHVNAGNFVKTVSNFVMLPLFHIESSISSKRLYRIINNRGVVRDIEISQKDLCSKSAFCNCVESRGNFLFTGSESDLAKIKSYLYDNTRSCQELTQLGWNPEGQFWAWSNGIYTPNGKFIPVDEYGCLEYKHQWYYMPACSGTTAQDKGLYRYERRFIHQASDADIFTWASKFVATFGDNAKIGICYYITCMFRDLAMDKYRSFPLLDIFGQRGSGKTKFVMSLLRLFGKDCEEGPNLGSDTIPAIADQMSKCFNGFVHLDEYKNNIEPVKIEMLKGAYENRGRGKMDMDHDKKRMRTPMDCGVVISGQEMTTADNALFSRVIYLTFNKTKFAPEEVDTFDDLKKYEERSLTGITNKILTLRSHVEQHYDQCCDEVKYEMRQMVDTRRVDERIVKNYSIILAIMKAVDGKINLPFSYKELPALFAKFIDRQNSTVSATSEVSDFWCAVETLFSNGNIDIEYDFRIGTTSDLTTQVGTGSDRKTVHYNTTMRVLYLSTTRVFAEYSKLTKQTKTNLQHQCDINALKSYLTAQDEYLGETRKQFYKGQRFSQEPDKGKTWSGEQAGKTIQKIQSRCMCFNYDRLKEEFGIDLYSFVGEKNFTEQKDNK